MNISVLNKHFKFVFQPKNKADFNNNRRFAVGAGRLEEYIGKECAENVIKKAWIMKGDKRRFQFRERGILDVYVH